MKRPDLFRQINVKVYSDEGGFQRFELRPEPGTMFTLAGIERAKTDMANLLMQQFPGRYFQFVKIRKNSFNVIPIKAASVVEVAEA